MGLRPMYQEGYLVKYDEGDESLQRAQQFYEQKEGDKTHIWKEGDTLTYLSLKYYGDPKLWYNIGDVNDIFNPFPDDIPLGTQILIPDIGAKNL